MRNDDLSIQDKMNQKLFWNPQLKLYINESENKFNFTNTERNNTDRRSVERKLLNVHLAMSWEVQVLILFQGHIASRIQ